MLSIDKQKSTRKSACTAQIETKIGFDKLLGSLVLHKNCQRLRILVLYRIWCKIFLSALTCPISVYGGPQFGAPIAATNVCGSPQLRRSLVSVVVTVHILHRKLLNILHPKMAEPSCSHYFISLNSCHDIKTA